MMWLYVFYAGDVKCKNADILKIDKSVSDRIKKELEEGKPVITIYPGESMISEKGNKMTVITYYQYIVMANVCKIILDDMN